MPTDNPRITVTLSDDELKLIDQYRYESGMPSLSKAVVDLAMKGLGKLDNRKPAGSPFTREELSLLHVYRHADFDSKNDIRSAALKANRSTRSKRRLLAATPESNSSNIDADQFQALFDYFRSLNNDERAEFILSIIGNQPDVTADDMIDVNPNLTEKSV